MRGLPTSPRARVTTDMLIAVFATIAIAAGSLVLEDIVPLPGEQQKVSLARCAILGVAGVLLLASVAWRSQMSRKLGTMYYVSYLHEWMADWHEDIERAVGERHLDERVVARHLCAAPIGGVIDAADQVQDLSHDLSRIMNEDSVETGYTLAPNALWPAALAVGYELYPWRDLRMLEFLPPTRGPSGVVSGDVLYWPLQSPEQPGPLAGGARPEVRLSAADGIGDCQSVLLTVDLTGKGQTTPPAGFAPDLRVRVAAFPAPGVIDDVSCDVRVDVRPRASRVVVRPQDVVDTVVEALRSALHDNPQATIYAILRVPKTVAVAIGFALTGRARGCAMGCQHESCRRPWGSLVLLLSDQSTRLEGMYHIMRVHPSQPSAATLAEQARAHGLILSGVQSNPGAPS